MSCKRIALIFKFKLLVTARTDVVSAISFKMLIVHGWTKYVVLHLRVNIASIPYFQQHFVIYFIFLVCLP